jgi:monoamine oxidase
MVRIGAHTYSLANLMREGMSPPSQVVDQITRRGVHGQSASRALSDGGLTATSRVVTLEWLAQVWATDPAELSVAGMRSIADAWRAGTGEFVLPDGYDAIARYLAQDLELHLSSPVDRVLWQRGHVQLDSAAQNWSAAAAVITVPPSVAARGLSFDPPLPAAKLHAAEAIAMGDAVCIVMRLTTPAPDGVWGLVVGARGGFWRADAGSYLVRGWMKGRSAAQARRRMADSGALVELAAGVMPWLSTAIVCDVLVADWGADPYARGAFSSPRVGMAHGPRWGEPEGETLFFAGEATCGARHPAMVHGAIESGARVAEEVLRALGGAREREH